MCSRGWSLPRWKQGRGEDPSSRLITLATNGNACAFQPSVGPFISPHRITCANNSVYLFYIRQFQPPSRIQMHMESSFPTAGSHIYCLISSAYTEISLRYGLDPSSKNKKQNVQSTFMLHMLYVKLLVDNASQIRNEYFRYCIYFLWDLERR